MMRSCMLFALTIAASLVAPAQAQDFLPTADDAVFGRSQELLAPNARQARQRLFAELNAEQQAAAAAIWSADDCELTGQALLERIAQVAAVLDPQARKLVEHCEQAPRSVLLPALTINPKLPRIARHNLQLLLGGWLVRERYYDEALEQLNALQPEQVADPASLLFYQAVAHHRLLNKQPGLAAIARLTEDVADCPRRYRRVALLMEQDLAALQPETIDHVARQMSDIERRLNLGRAGKDVRQREDDVIAALDRLIQRFQPPPPHPPCGPVVPGPRPAEESMLPSMRAPAQAAARQPAASGPWGNLSPGEREQALQQIKQAFPSNYRDVMERYFRKIASEGSDRANRD